MKVSSAGNFNFCGILMGTVYRNGGEYEACGIRGPRAFR
jgi:hypothetical protein